MTTTSYQIDSSHSNVEFSIRHLMIAKVRGRFSQVAGSLEIDPDDITRSRVTAEIQAASITTAEEKRDAHLRSADFFDVEKYPLITFASTKVERDGDDLRVTGNLTIHGVTKEITLDVEQLGTAKDPWGNQRVAFAAKGSLDRKAFGLGWNQVLEAGGFLVGDKVEITLDVQAVQAAGSKAA
ncbi:MAG TPA: YceI family protein [Kofleriaceae bacterium]|nr:YceI family protein [Kofleriaceae bacterium]